MLIKKIEKKLKKLNNSNLTPLHIAAYNCSKEIFEKLILKGADINAIALNYQKMIMHFLLT